MTKKLFKGTICRIFTQCPNPTTGKIGCFLSTAYEGEKNTPECVASPHFHSLVDLFLWMHEMGFEPVSDSINSPYLSPHIEVSVA